MKAMKAKKVGMAMGKGELFEALGSAAGVEKKEVKAVLGALETVIPAQLKAKGKFTLPGIAMLKLRKKPATKAGKRMAFGKLVAVKAKPASTVVKCFAVKALKTAI